MSSEVGTAQQGEQADVYAFVAEEMKNGADKASIAQKLQEQGVGRSDAEQLVDTVYRQITAAVTQEAISPRALLPAALGGVIGALIGGAIWAGIVILTDYEVGFVAWGIGALCGFGVLQLAGTARGVPLQVIAVATSVLGIVLGKYMAFFYYLKEVVEEDYGAEAAAGLTIASQEAIGLFAENFRAMISGYDALWVILAVVTAWGIPKASGIKLATGTARG